MGIERLTGDPRSKETIEHGHDIRTKVSHTRSLAPHTDKNLRCGRQRDATLALASGLPRNYTPYTLLADLQLPICATTNYDGFLARAIGATGVANPSVDQQIRTRGLNRRSRAAAGF